MLDLLMSQLADPFRIGMMAALVYIWQRNGAERSGPLPLVAGYAFVAVLLPLTWPGGPVVPRLLMGLVSNAILLAVILGLRFAWISSRRPR